MMKTVATGRISSFYMGMYPSACCRSVAIRLATPDFDASIIGNIRATRCLRRCGCELCPQKWTFGHTKTDTYRFKEQFHRFETVMPETRYVDDVSH